MKKLLLACTIFAAAGAWAQVPLEFKGIALGSSVSRFMALFEDLPTVTCAGEYQGVITCSGFIPPGRFTYADCPVDFVKADFVDDRLEAVMVTPYGGTGSIVEHAITAKYRGPSGSRKMKQVLPDGREYQARVVEWRLKGGAISLQDHPAPRSTVIVSIASSSWRAREQAAARPTAKAKNDI